MNKQLLERFLRYVSFDTQSSYQSETFPSTARQLELLSELVEEMISIGLADVEIDANGYVTATIPASEGAQHKPSFGLLAHVDTSPDMSGRNVRPQISENYQGQTIALGEHYSFSPEEFPDLLTLCGHTLITADGSTLLGADDKAGIAIIMTAAEYLISHPESPRPRVRICFTPDEEVGRGVDHFDVAHFDATAAYTLDGSTEGELEFENFNAASAVITIAGRNIHPGYAKDKMVNALQVAWQIHSELPADQRPENTQGYEGFFHLHDLQGSVGQAKMEYIIRDHSRVEFDRRKTQIADIAARYGAQAEIRDQYYNMRDQIELHPQIVERARLAMIDVGVEPRLKPIRGGTDGARLSYMGLPCPNIFTGGMNFHGRYECCSLEVMERAVSVVIALAARWSE